MKKVRLNMFKTFMLKGILPSLWTLMLFVSMGITNAQSTVRSIPEDDLDDLGKKGFIYPYSTEIYNRHGNFVYEDYEFEDFAMMNGDDPARNTQFPQGELEKNLIVQHTKEANGVTSWVITFWPKGRIYNKPSDPNRSHSLDNAVAGVAFTKGIDIIDNTITVESYNVDNGSHDGEKIIHPGRKENLNNQISDANKAEFTLNESRTKTLFFGKYYERRDPITVRAGGLKTNADNDYERMFDKCFVFESSNTDKKKWVITFKTKQNYENTPQLNAYKNTGREIRRDRDKYINGVMAGIGSYQNNRTVSGVKFYGKHLTDKFIFTKTIDVNETFLTKENSITVPARDITFNKAISRRYSGNIPIEYSVAINETLKMPNGQTLNGNLKAVNTKYMFLDYEKYEDDGTSLNSDYNHVEHTDYTDIDALTESMTPISGYTTKIKERDERHPRIEDRTLVIDITHTSGNYLNPEEQIKQDLDELTEQLTYLINDYPLGVGHAEVTKSDAENLDDVPTQAQLDELKAKQDEIKAKIEKIKATISTNSPTLGSAKTDEFNKIINGYEDAFNGLNKDTPNEYAPKYDEVQNLNGGTITSPKSGQPYYDIVKELNNKVKKILDDNADVSGIRTYYSKANSVKNSDRYNNATTEKKKAFDDALAYLLVLYRKGVGNVTLAEMLKMKRDLNKAIIELDNTPNPPTLTAPREGDSSVTTTIPEKAKAGDVIKVYKLVNGTETEVGSYTLTERDLSKTSVNVPLNSGKTITEGEKLNAKTVRDGETSEASNTVTVEAAPINPPTLTAPREGYDSVTSTVPDRAKAGDVIKIYKVVNGTETEVGSYTLTEEDLSKSSINVPLNNGETITEGEELNAKTIRNGEASVASNTVTVKEVLVCTQTPRIGTPENTLVGISTLRSNHWNLEGLGAYIALESNKKGFVITRNANPEANINNPVEGMLVWDTTDKCLKLYSDKTGTPQWNCIKQGCNRK